MEAFVGGIGLQWRVYNEYLIEDINGKQGIFPDFEKGISSIYNPNKQEERKSKKRRSSRSFTN